MATTVIKSIGTASRDYSTLQSWEDAAPVDLTATRSNTCTGGTTSTIILDVGASASNSAYVGNTVTNASAEERLITAYNGTTKIATIGVLNGSSATWTAPTTGQAFTINAVIWQGQAYNDSEFSVAGTVLTVAGSTANSTHYKELTTATGQSFMDQAGVRTNLLAYNVSNGVGLKKTSSYGGVVSSDEDYFRMSRVQINNSSANGRVLTTTAFPTGNIFKDIICTWPGVVEGIGAGSAAILINIVGYNRGTAGNGFILRASSQAIGCSIIRNSSNSAAGTAFVSSYSNNIIQSCASFGFTTCASASGWDTTNSKNNGTDAPSGFPGSTGNQYSIPYTATTPLTQAGVSGLDLRSIAATTLAGNGFLDATNAPNDISGYARPAGPTIGHWQIATTSVVQQRLSLMGVGS